MSAELKGAGAGLMDRRGARGTNKGTVFKLAAEKGTGAVAGFRQKPSARSGAEQAARPLRRLFILLRWLPGLDSNQRRQTYANEKGTALDDWDDHVAHLCRKDSQHE
jgi:hypothetical protein